MLGLIKKDLFLIKGNMKTLVILLCVYVVMAFQGQMSLSFILPVMSVILMISTFSYDAYNKWDAYTITLPNGRKNSVKSKYLTTILLVAITTIIVMTLEIVIAYAREKTIDFENIISSILGGIIATSLIQIFMYPAIYKFGVEKARIGVFIGVFGVTILAGVIAKSVDFNSLFKSLSFINDYWMIVVPIIMILMLYISYKISERIYLKKEF